MSFNCDILPRLMKMKLSTIAVACMAILFLTACKNKITDPVDEPVDHILYLSTRVGGVDQFDRPLQDIYRMNTSGDDIKNLTGRPAWRFWNLNLSPEGNRLLFTSTLDCDIWAMNTAGSNMTRLTGQSSGANHRCNKNPHWSPDGSQIAFATNRENRSYQVHSGLYDAYVMNADGSNSRNVSHSLGDETGMDLSVIGWTPDGTHVVFESSTHIDGKQEIMVYVVKPDGSDLRPLFNTNGNHSPFWSPDRSKIVFIRELDGKRRLHIMSADGSNIQALTSHSGDDWLPGIRGGSGAAISYNPWSPDGAKIAFDRDALDEWGTYVINTDGSNLTRLSDRPSRFNGWSLDGTRIAFTSRIFPTDIYIVNPDGSDHINLTNSPSDDSDAIWLPC
jgi:Tol biopolymer transport system component